jgi:hypothetical protein
MSTQRFYTQRVDQGTKARPAGYYVVRAGSNGRVTKWVAGPFETGEQAKAVRAQQR